MGLKQGGGLFYLFGAFFTSEPCSDPLCCWNAPGPPFFTILASLFLHFCVAARYKEQLLLPPPPQTGGVVKLHFFIPPPPTWGGNYTFGRCLGSELCSDPLCCWNAPGPGFFTILASLFPHFCVAARYQEQLFFLPPPNWGGAKSSNTRGGALRKHFPSAAHSETLSSGPSPPQTGGGNFTFFVAVSACLFRQSTWRC